MVSFRFHLAEVIKSAPPPISPLDSPPIKYLVRFTVLALLTLGSALSAAAQTNSLLVSWLSAQTNFQTWSADFVQTRTLKSLTQPLTAKGRVWFAEPNLFRWELGNPPQTIAVRAPDQMLVISP